jgi:DNA-binding IclR family transcriptional regulator
MTRSGARKIGSAERVFDIIEILRDYDGATVSVVADELDTAVSTAHQYLHTIEERSFIVRENNEYHVSLRFLDYGTYARSLQPAQQLAKEKVQELAEETGERAQYVVPQHGSAVVLYTATEKKAVKTGVTPGTHAPLHASAAGKAIIASFSDERIFDIIETKGLHPLTEHTITDRDHLLTELERIREEDVAFNDQEHMNRLRAVGVPVRNPNDDVMGALSVSAPTNRFKGDIFTQEIPDLLLGTANELELNIEYSE